MSGEILSDDTSKLQKEAAEDTIKAVNGSCNGPEDVTDSADDSPAQEESKPSEQEKDVEAKTQEAEPEAKEDSSDTKEEEMKQQEDTSEEKEAETSAVKEEEEEDERKKEEQSDEDEDDDSEEELPPGLLERPIEIIKTKRERKKTTRFTYDDVPTPSSEKKKLEIPEGRGVKLIDHPRVEWQLQRNKVEDLKIIHKLFFGVFGDLMTCKKNMRNFNGFPFEKDSPEYEKKEDYLGRFTSDNLKWALTVCDVENRKGKKEDLMDYLLEWCLCPKPSGKPLPKKKAKKEKTTKKKKKTKKTPAKTKKNDVSLTSDDVSDDESGSEKEEETPKKTKETKKSPKKSTPKTTPKSPKKRKATASPKKLAKVKIGSPKKSDEADSDDEGPSNKKAKKPPTNAQVRKDVANILKGADLEVITMKAVCMKVYALYPDFDLSDKKAFIKETVKAIIS